MRCDCGHPGIGKAGGDHGSPDGLRATGTRRGLSAAAVTRGIEDPAPKTQVCGTAGLAGGRRRVPCGVGIYYRLPF